MSSQLTRPDGKFGRFDSVAASPAPLMASSVGSAHLGSGFVPAYEKPKSLKSDPPPGCLVNFAVGFLVYPAEFGFLFVALLLLLLRLLF